MLRKISMDSRRYLSRAQAQGSDDFGRNYRRIEEVWEENKDIQRNWYDRANQYWSSQDATVETVLGGIAALQEPDIKESSQFLDEVIATHHLNTGWALDCGAGIGRVTKFLLLDRFDNIDLLEQCEKFMEVAPAFIGSDKAKNFYAVGAQDCELEDTKYDLIWIQWVLSQLTDVDAVTFLKKVRSAVKPEGLVVVKENISTEGFVWHREDQSITRHENALKHFFTEAGLQLLSEKQQVDWPEDLLSIKMFALKSSSN